LKVDTPEETIKQIRQLAKIGVDVVKIMASGGGTRGISPGKASFARSKLEMMAEEAHA